MEKTENTEKRNHFLNGLELSGRKFVRPDAVGRNLKTTFKEGDASAREDHRPKGRAALFEMAVPNKRHEDVRDSQQQDGSQNFSPEKTQ
jgi:hypothetical protein